MRRSGLVLAVVAVAFAAHLVGEASAWAINVDGSHSSLIPATPDRVALDLTIYYAANAVAIGGYALLLWLALRGRIRGVGRTAVLAAPLILQILLWLPRPWLSTDVLSYVAQGFVGTVAGGNPYVNPARDVLDTGVGAQLEAIGWRPQAILSPYGPLWTAYESAVMTMTRDVSLAVLLMKLPALLGALGSAALIWRILGMVRPRLRLLGTIAFVWNPVVIAELAAEGHLDGLMVFLLLAGLYVTLRNRPVASSVLAAAAALTKYVPIVLVPAQAVYLWRTTRDTAHMRRRLMLGGAVGAGLIVATFAPFWAGLQTLEGLRVMGQPGPWPTATGLVYRYVERAHPWLDGGVAASLLITGGFLVYLVHASLGVRDARSLLAASSRIGLAWVLVASPVFYPWYAVLPVALVALTPEVPYLVVILALTVTSRVVAPLVDLRLAFEPIPASAHTLTTAGLALTVAVAVAFAVRRLWTWAATEEPPPATA